MRRWSMLVVAVVLWAAVPVQAAAPVRRHAVEVGSDALRATVRAGVVTPTGPTAWPLGTGAADGEFTVADARIAAASSLVRMGAPDEVMRQAVQPSSPTP